MGNGKEPIPDGLEQLITLNLIQNLLVLGGVNDIFHDKSPLDDGRVLRPAR
jgi:hypothetical protein